MRSYRWRAFMDHEKEEDWLNDLAARGFAFADLALFRYSFEDCEPGEYTYRIELLNDLPMHPESQRYLGFMAENGVEHVASYFRWVYLRRKTAEGSFELFSDIDSRIAHYRRIALVWLVMAFVEMCFLLSQIPRGIGYLSAGAHGGSSADVFICLLFIVFFVLFLRAWILVRLKIKKLNLERSLRE